MSLLCSAVLTHGMRFNLDILLYCKYGYIVFDLNTSINKTVFLCSLKETFAYICSLSLTNYKIAKVISKAFKSIDELGFLHFFSFQQGNCIKIFLIKRLIEP